MRDKLQSRNPRSSTPFGWGKNVVRRPYSLQDQIEGCPFRKRRRKKSLHDAYSPYFSLMDYYFNCPLPSDMRLFPLGGAPNSSLTKFISRLTRCMSDGSSRKYLHVFNLLEALKSLNGWWVEFITRAIIYRYIGNHH